MTGRSRLFSVVGALALIVSAGVVVLASPASAQQGVELCGLNDTIEINNREQIVMNNVWGAQTTQCIQVNQANGDFAITRSDHNNPGGQVASYPVIFEGCHWDFCTAGSELPLPVDNTAVARSDWTINTSNVVGGTWNAAYDLWYHTSADTARAPDGAELMIWLDWGGGAGPAGGQVASNVPIAGATWNVHFAQFTDWNYIAYLRTSPTSSVSNLDINAFTQDAVSRGYIQPSWYLSAVEAGFELWRQGAGLASSGFSFTGQSGGSQPPPPPPSPQPPPPGPQPPPPPPPTGGCSAVYQLAGEWSGGFQGGVTVTNPGNSSASGWQVTLSFPNGQQIQQLWGGSYSQSGGTATVTNESWNGSLSPGASASFGFLGSHSGTNGAPTATCSLT